MNRKLKLAELGRLDTETFRRETKMPVTVVLDNVRSHHNVGSIFRTADAFLIEEMILCGYTPVPPHREIHKTALGATDAVSWNYEASTLEAVTRLRAQGYVVYAVEQAERTVLLQDMAVGTPQKTAFVFGNEVSGVAQEVVDACTAVLEIPQFGTKHSLNISVCAGMVLWECVRRIKWGN